MGYTPETKKPSIKASEIIVPEGAALVGGGGSSGTPVSSITSAANLGGGANVFSTISSGQLQFRSVTAGAGIQVTQNTNDIQVRVKPLTALGAFVTSSATVNALTFSASPTQAELEAFRNAVKAQLDNILVDLNTIKTYIIQLET